MLAKQLYKRLGCNATLRQALIAKQPLFPREQFGLATTTYFTRNMATSSKVELSPTQGAQFFIPGVSTEAAETASKLLQKNHEQTHIFFNDDGFHVSSRPSSI
jgi:hypothetical protein